MDSMETGNERNREEPVLVNVTRMDREKYFEAVLARTRYGRSRVLFWGGAVIAAVGLLAKGRAVAVMGVIIAVLAVLAPLLIGRRDFHRLCAIHPGGEWTKTVRFFRDRVETDHGDGRISSATYGQIRREAETKHMYILEFGRSLPAATFDKEGFTRGTVEELRSFLTDARRAVYNENSEEDPSQTVD